MEQNPSLCKVLSQVNVPRWIIRNQDYMRAALRGLFDTDGSVYKLKLGSVQISFKNMSKPLLDSTRLMLNELGFSPSKITVNSIYLTRKSDTQKYFEEIGFSNFKHKRRYLMYTT